MHYGKVNLPVWMMCWKKVNWSIDVIHGRNDEELNSGVETGWGEKVSRGKMESPFWEEG